MMTQPINPEMVVIFTNHPKTIELLLFKTKYTSGEGRMLSATAYHGVPNRLHSRKIFGACPSELSP